jgi:hypothetical protein
MWREGIAAFGPDPPFDAAITVVLSEDYVRRYGSKMPMGPNQVGGNLLQAKEAHEHRDDPGYVPPMYR